MTEIDSFRGQHETDEQWEMRRKFLEMHWGTCGTNRLLCLSQALLNVHFLGCKYSPELMETLMDMGAGILEEVSAKSEGRLKRTLASAGSAAEAKATKAKPNYAKPNGKSKQTMIYKATEPQETFPKNLVSPELEDNRVMEIEYYPTGQLSRFVILEITKPNDVHETPQGIMSRSANASGVTIQVQTEAEPPKAYQRSLLIIDGCKVVSALFENKKSISPVMYNLAYRYLKKHHYSVRYKMDTNEGDEVVAKSDVSGPVSSSGEQAASSVGAKLLQMLGWKGGGLGKNEQGMSQPVQVDAVIGRSGLGFSGGPALTQKQLQQFRRDVNDYLRKYKITGSTDNLKFSSDFTNEERATIHKASRALGLKSQSFGSKDNRTMIISHPIPKTNLIEVVRFWKANGGVSHPQVYVIPPAGESETPAE